LLNDHNIFKTLVAYEETKGIPDIVEGKTIQYHAFVFDAPVHNGAEDSRYGAPGMTLTDLLENSRRDRLVAQPPDGVVPGIALFWRQGIEEEGAPADIMLKVSPEVEMEALAAAPTLNISSHTPQATAQNLEDATFTDALEDARAHRAVLRGEFLIIGYSYTDNGPAARFTNTANYNFWVRRSLDGGQTWLNPQNISQIGMTEINVKEPRLVAPPKTGSQDDGCFIIAWGTETNVFEGIDTPEPLDMMITRSSNQGETFERVQSLGATQWAEFESQLRTNDDCSEVYAVWMQDDGIFVNVLYVKGRNP
jgi:hypothetical protein